MRLSAVTNLTLVISVALIACSNTEGTPGQTASSGSPSTTSTEEGEPSSGKGGSGAAKTSAKTTSGGKTTAASKAKGGTSSTTDGEDDPQQEGGSGGETTATKASSSSAKTGGAGGTSGSKPGSSTKGGSTGSGSSKTATGGTGARTTANTTARGGTSATTTTAATTQAQNVTVPRLTNGQPGKTTRYWDCCKPSCGWSANAQAAGKSNPATACGQDGVTLLDKDAKNKCWDNGPAFQCYWGAPWQVGPNVSYGFAAFNGPNCGKCYQLDFNDGKTMIVQAINIGTISENQFDLLIPGGGVGAAKDVACKAQWNGANLGAENGGFRATCGNDANCLKNMCQAAFGSSKQMMDACTWYTGWFNSGDNPSMVYAEVQCPAEITSRSGLR